MDAVHVILFVLLCGGAFAVWRRSRYPGGWGFALSVSYANERAELAEARQALRHVDERSNRAETDAREHLKLEQEKSDRRVREAKARLVALEDPGLGEQLAQCGELRLHEHAVVTSPAGRVIPLAGLRARFDSGSRAHSIYLEPPDGRHYRASFVYRLTQATEAAETVKLFDEEQVRDFEVMIHHAIADERVFRTDHRLKFSQAQEELADAYRSTGALDAARQRLAEVTDRNREDPRRHKALADLEAARDSWERLTKRRPPR